jgi:hypothetical protein
MAKPRSLPSFRDDKISWDDKIFRDGKISWGDKISYGRKRRGYERAFVVNAVDELRYVGGGVRFPS